MGGDDEDEQVILNVGACCLDRLLTVTTYPEADAKVRTTAYHEYGGGNAGNTATTMALLRSASFFGGESSNIKIKILSKVGDDSVGKQLANDLRTNGVDLSLFQVVAGSTTSCTTVIVSEIEHTRTCFFTPGSCGELTMKDLDELDMNEIFQNVVLLNSDGRHTEVANALAKEAQRRGIPVAVDPEKDRNTPAQDELMELATTLFTNSEQLESYYERRGNELECKHGRPPVSKPKIVASAGSTTSNIEIVANSIRPSAFYLRWHNDRQFHKEVVLTKGKLGALRVVPTKLESCKENPGESLILVHSSANNPITIDHTVSTEGTHFQFAVEAIGVVQDVTIIDSTGAGDAFIGGYLLCKLLHPDSSQLALQFGTWVASKKLRGPGARSALPSGIDVDNMLGRTQEDVQCSLQTLIGPFGE